MKKLPNEFTFICDENSREQLEKLGVDLNDFEISSISQTYLVKNNVVVTNDYGGWSKKFKYAENLTPINLTDYIEQEQPEPKWQDRTRGGYEYHIYEEFEGKIFGRIKINEEWHGLHWNLDGRFHSSDCEDSWDLLPINHFSQPYKKN